MKKIISIFLLVIMCFSFSVCAESKINVNLDGKTLEFDTYPVNVSGRVLVPVRKIFEELGGVVTWDNDTRTATSVSEGLKITITIDADYMTVNDKKVPLDVSARILENRTLVPTRAIAESFGCNVDWDGDNQLVIIETLDYKSKKDTFKKYTSENGYTILYPEKDGYVMTTSNPSVPEADFILLNQESATMLCVTTKDATEEINLENEELDILKFAIEYQLGTKVDDFAKMRYNNLDVIKFSYTMQAQAISVQMTQMIYIADNNLYTVTMCVSPLTTDEMESDFEFVLNSLCK